VSGKVIRDQIQTLRDSSINAAKVGEVDDLEAARVISSELAACGASMIVVDPELAREEEQAASADPHLARAYRESLVPGATVVTVDLQEAANLLQRAVDPPAAVRGLVGAGARWVVVKGIHTRAAGAPYEDLVSNGTQWFEIRSEVQEVAAKGVGAAFAAALTAYLALGHEVPAAAEKARQFVVEALKEVAGGSRNGSAA
jgi:hydroxymethylpyrimidine/phosphomethylpyrimidine kinase